MRLSKIEETMHALVLSCNDVIADCLIVDMDEEGVRPIAYTQVHLPMWVGPSRETSPMGTPAIKRGDYLKLSVEIAPEQWISETEESISELMDIFREGHEDDANLILKLEDHNKEFDKTWQKTVRSDYIARTK